MADANDLDTLIGAIYDCVLNPVGWNNVLRRIQQQLGAVSSYLLLHDDVGRSMDVLIECDVDPAMRQSYLDRYITLNPVLPYLMSIGAGETYSCSHLVTQRRFRESEFYRDWAAPQAWFDYAGVTLVRERDAAAAIGFTRATEGNVFDDAAMATLRRLAPHLTRAAAMQLKLDRVAESRADLQRLLGVARFGALVVDGDARIHYANPVAETLLARRDGVASERGVLAAGSATPALRSALRAAARRETSAISSGSLLAHRGDGRRPLVVHVMPAADTVRGGFAPMRLATALVFIIDPEVRADGMIDIFGDAYRLTKGERQVLSRLACGDTPAEIAKGIRIGLPTVRTHLQRLYSKTETRRQAELLTLFLQSTLPIGG